MTNCVQHGNYETVSEGRTILTQENDYSRWKRDALMAVGAGLAAALVMGLTAFAVGRVTGSEARFLVEAILPTSRYLCATIITACSTILALMLTLIGMLINAKLDVKPVFYHRIKQVAFYDMVLLIVATCLLLVHCVPITKSEEIPHWWYHAVYYGLLVFSAVLGGAMIAIVMMLYAAVRDVIKVFGLDQEMGLRINQSKSEEPSEPQSPDESESMDSRD